MILDGHVIAICGTGDTCRAWAIDIADESVVELDTRGGMQLQLTPEYECNDYIVGLLANQTGKLKSITSAKKTFTGATMTRRSADLPYKTREVAMLTSRRMLSLLLAASAVIAILSGCYAAPVNEATEQGGETSVQSLQTRRFLLRLIRFRRRTFERLAIWPPPLRPAGSGSGIRSSGPIFRPMTP